MQGPDYRTILQETFQRRVNHNPSYSLRAFARDLKLAPSQLYGILNGKLGLSLRSATQVGRALGLSKKEVDHFIDLVECRHARSQSARIHAMERIKAARGSRKNNQVCLDHFQFLSDWYHMALLEATYLRDFRPDELWLANRLKVNVGKVVLAIQRLERLRLIQKKGPIWRAINDWSEVLGEVPSMAIREFHRQVMGKAEASLRNDPIDCRDIRSTVMAIRKDRIEDAKKMLRKFHEEFNVKIGEEDKLRYAKDEVYCLQTSFFPMTGEEK